jgi:DNA polymerase/3'-5' exonuclease PolX
MDNSIRTIEESYRVIKTLEDQSLQYESQLKKLIASKGTGNIRRIGNYKKDINQIVNSLKHAEYVKQSLLSKMKEYIAKCTAYEIERMNEERSNHGHPLLKRSGVKNKWF